MLVNDMEDFLKKLGITETGEYTKDGSYVVDIKDYDDYGKFFSILDKSELVNEVQDTCQLTIHTTNITYTSEDYQIVLQADLDEDIYKLVVTQF